MGWILHGQPFVKSPGSSNTRPPCTYMKGKFPTPVNCLSGKFPGVSRGGMVTPGIDSCISDKEVSEIKINSVLKNTKGLCKNTKTIDRLRLSDYRGIFTSYKHTPILYSTNFWHSSKVQIENCNLIMALFVATKLQPYNSTALQLYSPTALQLYSSTTLQPVA